MADEGRRDRNAARRGRAAIAALGWLAASGACASPDEGATTRAARGAAGAAEAPVEIELRPYVGRLVTVDARVGGDSVRLIFDTAAGKTVISPAVADRIGCEVQGRSVGFRMDGERVEFERCPDVALSVAGERLAIDEVGVWDIASILPPDLPPVDGVLSLRSFAGRPVTLDLANRRLTLETDASLADRTAAMERLRSRISTGLDGGALTVFVHGAAPSPGWFLLDSANLDVVRLGPHMAPPAPGEEVAEIAVVLDGVAGIEVPARSADILYDGALSEGFIREWVLTFDLRAESVWASPAEPDPPDASGAGEDSASARGG